MNQPRIMLVKNRVNVQSGKIETRQYEVKRSKVFFSYFFFFLFFLPILSWPLFFYQVSNQKYLYRRVGEEVCREVRFSRGTVWIRECKLWPHWSNQIKVQMYDVSSRLYAPFFFAEILVFRCSVKVGQTTVVWHCFYWKYNTQRREKITILLIITFSPIYIALLKGRAAGVGRRKKESSAQAGSDRHG